MLLRAAVRRQKPRAFSTSATDGQSSSELHYFGKKKQSQVSLKALMETGQGTRLNEFAFASSVTPKASVSDRVKIQVACFLHRELPVRLAHRACELEDYPLFSKSSAIRNVCSWYKQSFQQLRECPAPTDVEKEERFSKAIESIYERHSHTLITMAKGAHEIRQTLQQDISTFAEHGEIQERLDAFYSSRIGIRMVCACAYPHCSLSLSLSLSLARSLARSSLSQSPPVPTSPAAAHWPVLGPAQAPSKQRHDWSRVAVRLAF